MSAMDKAMSSIGIGASIAMLTYQFITKEQSAPKRSRPRGAKAWMKAVLQSFEPVNHDYIGSIRVPTMGILARLSVLAFGTLLGFLASVFALITFDPKMLTVGVLLSLFFLFLSLSDIRTLRDRAERGSD